MNSNDNQRSNINYLFIIDLYASINNNNNNITNSNTKIKQSYKEILKKTRHYSIQVFRFRFTELVARRLEIKKLLEALVTHYHSANSHIYPQSTDTMRKY